MGKAIYKMILILNFKVNLLVEALKLLLTMMGNLTDILSWCQFPRLSVSWDAVLCI